MVLSRGRMSIKKVRLTLWFTKAEYKRLKKAAKEEKINVAGYVYKKVERYVEYKKMEAQKI